MCKILVVDDAPDYREMLRGILSDEGYAVRVATNEGEALDAVIHESFDFALVDVRLHDGGEDDESGSSLAMAFRALDPQIRVILLTRYVKAEQIVRAIRYLGVVDFIEKAPDVRERILKIIAKPQKARNETVSIQPVIATVEKSISERPYLIKLRRILAERFDAGELRTLCFDLGVDYGNLPGESKADKARELVAYLERRDRIYKLAQVGRKHRSDIPWDDILEETRQATEKFDTVGNVTQLSLALAENRSLTIRARGHYVYSEETPKILQVNIKRYVRKTDLARKDIDNLRFHIGEIGFDLWREIFTEHPEVERAYIEARAKSQSLLLLFETCREFLQLPIEFLRSETPPEYLVLQHPLARFLRNAIPKREAISPHMLALTDKLRVLIIASNTVPLIDGVDVETQKLANYLRHQDWAWFRTPGS
ncbi:MAG: response regulator [Proteobacteria bacterium]|nr:response regulator [Pseudomonadota bacterium]